MKYWKFGVLAFVLVAAGLIYTQSGNFHVDSQNGRYHAKAKPTGTRAISSNADIIQQINDDIVGIKSKSEIKPLIEKLITISESEAHKDNQAVQLYRAMLEPMKHMESVIWRLRHVVEKSGLLHMQALAMIRKAYHKDYMYGPHLRAILDYLTMPSDTLLQFNKIENFQDFIETEIKPTLSNSLIRVKNAIQNTDSNWSFPFDAYLTSGYDEENNKVFISDSKRFEKRVNHQYLYFIEANLHRALGSIDYIVNYNLNDYPRVVNKMVKRTAVNSLKQKLRLRSLPEPITPKDMVEAVNTYSKFLTLRKEPAVAQTNMNQAMNHFHSARVRELLGFQKSIDETDHNNTDQYFLNPNILKIGREETENKLRDKIALFESAKSGQVKTVTSEVTGQQIQFDLRVLFTAHDNLKTFLPRGNNINQEGGKGGNVRDDKGRLVRHSITNQKLFAWNYMYGKPISWPDPTFAGLLPGGTNENLYDIARTMELTDALDNLKELIPIP